MNRLYWGDFPENKYLYQFCQQKSCLEVFYRENIFFIFLSVLSAQSLFSGGCFLKIKTDILYQLCQRKACFQVWFLKLKTDISISSVGKKLVLSVILENKYGYFHRFFQWKACFQVGFLKLLFYIFVRTINYASSFHAFKCAFGRHFVWAEISILSVLFESVHVSKIKHFIDIENPSW